MPEQTDKKYTIGIHYHQVYEVPISDFQGDENKAYEYAVRKANELAEYASMTVTQIDVFPTPEVVND